MLGYKTPDKYFENLSDRLHTRLKHASTDSDSSMEHKHSIGMIKRFYPWIMSSAAIALILFYLLNGTTLLNAKNNIITASHVLEYFENNTQDLDNNLLLDIVMFDDEFNPETMTFLTEEESNFYEDNYWEFLSQDLLEENMN